MTPTNLTLNRIVSEWKLQYNAWKTAVDWIVALYILVPALMCAIYQYWLWWINPSHWMSSIHEVGIYLVCFLFAWSGTIRVFLEDGDQLFLVHNRYWMTGVIKCGLVYSFVVYFLQSIFFFVLLAPFWFFHEQSVVGFAKLLAITFILRVLLGLAKQLLELQFAGWRQFAASSISFFLGLILFSTLAPKAVYSLTVFWSVIIVLLLCCKILIPKRLDMKGSFFADVAREQSQRLKYISFLLTVSGVSIKKSKRTGGRSWLFRSSNPIFKNRDADSRLVELFIKLILRNRQRLGMYIQMIFILVLIIISVRGVWQLLFWFAFCIVLINYVGIYWQEIMNSEFMQIFGQNYGSWGAVLRRFLCFVTFPGFLLISVPIGFYTYRWIGAAIIVPVSYYTVYFLSNAVAFYIESKKPG